MSEDGVSPLCQYLVDVAWLDKASWPGPGLVATWTAPESALTCILIGGSGGSPWCCCTTGSQLHIQTILRFWGHERVKAALSRKLSLACDVPQMSTQLMRLFMAASHWVQAPWWPWGAAFKCYCDWTSLVTLSTTIDFCCFLVAFDQNHCGAPQYDQSGLTPSPLCAATWRWHSLLIMANNYSKK